MSFIPPSVFFAERREISMKIKIITIHNIPNFGSVFQCLALCEYLKSLGAEDVNVIDYNPDYFKEKTLRSKIGKIINWRFYKNRTYKFKGFIDTYIPLTPKSSTTLQELAENEKDADLYIAGGDQLWNVYHDCGKDDAYKLTWVQGRKISYGTSLGQKDFTDLQLQELGNKISDYQYVAVRESSSIQMLKRVGINAFHSVDPVFLLDREQYEQYLTPIEQPRYLLVYLVTPSVLLEKCISYLSEKYKLKVILCSGFSKKCSCDLFLKDLGPDEILSYIRNAEIVLSSSFHATAFSLIFEKQFFTILPDAHTNERIEDLLKIQGLDSRIVRGDVNLENVLSQKIDFVNISSYEDRIIASKEYIKKAIENV